MRRLTRGPRSIAPSWLIIRFGALAAALGGVLFLSWGYVHQGASPLPLAIFARILAYLVPFLFLLALVGVRTRCVGLIGRLAESGFVIGYLGSAWGSLLSVVPASFWYEHFSKSGRMLLPLNWLPWLLAGLMAVGISLVRIEMLRGYGTLLLVMGLLGWAYQLTDSMDGLPGTPQAHVVFGLLFGLAWITLGYALWRDQHKQFDQSRN